MSNAYSNLTHFIESNALLAVQSDDLDAAREILADATAYELDALATVARELSRLCWDLSVRKADEDRRSLQDVQRALGEG
jgi:hypothetical protein